MLSLVCFNSSLADFSNTRAWSHPLYATANEAYILEIRGDWSSDCHPGEQKPVIKEYTGDSVLIEFEIIVEHVTCNDVVTPYRVLVDISDVVGDVPGEFRLVEVTLRYGGDESVQQVKRPCLLCDPEINDGNTLYKIEMLSPERLSMDWVGAMIAEIHLPTHIAVRVD